MADDCIFCQVAAGSVPADVVARGNGVLAFRDLNPQAPVHVLVIPEEHLNSAHDITPEHAAMLLQLVGLANQVADSEGISAGGYRIVANIGRDGGQTVHHLHLHVLGGRRMSWPPG